MAHVSEELTPQKPAGHNDSNAPRKEAGQGRDDAPEQMRIRAGKRQTMLDEGKQPYPVELPITPTIAQVREAYGHLEAGEETDDVVGIAGRVMLMRNGGKLCFATLQDGAGVRIQVMLSAASVGPDSLATYKSEVDLGDHLFVHGRVISSRRGELSIMAEPGEGEDAPAWKIASKALRPLPKTYTCLLYTSPSPRDS